MRKVFIYAFAALLMGGFVASCSDDDPEIEIPEKPEPEPEPEPVVCPIADGTVFIDGKGLNLKYSDNQLLGKQVKFVADASDATKATLELSANKEALAGALPVDISGNSGVIPGEQLTKLNLNLVIDGDKVSFEGKDELNGRVINYKGTGSKDSIALDLKVTMPIVEGFSGKSFSLLAISNKKPVTTPIVTVWNSKAAVPMFGTAQALLDLVRGIGFPVIEGKNPMTADEMLIQILNQITFLADGNIQAKYKENLTDTEYQTSPLNLATYKFDVEKKQLLLFINVPQILAFEASKQKSRADGEEGGLNALLTDLLAKALSIVNQALVDGIPLSYEVKDNVTTVYLDEKTVLPVLQLVKPLLLNAEFMQLVNQLIGQVLGPELAPQLTPLINMIISAIPDAIDKTESMRFGINLVNSVE